MYIRFQQNSPTPLFKNVSVRDRGLADDGVQKQPAVDKHVKPTGKRYSAEGRPAVRHRDRVAELAGRESAADPEAAEAGRLVPAARRERGRLPRVSEGRGRGGRSGLSERQVRGVGATAAAAAVLRSREPHFEARAETADARQRGDGREPLCAFAAEAEFRGRPAGAAPEHPRHQHRAEKRAEAVPAFNREPDPPAERRLEHVRPRDLRGRRDRQAARKVDSQRRHDRPKQRRQAHRRPTAANPATHRLRPILRKLHQQPGAVQAGGGGRPAPRQTGARDERGRRAHAAAGKVAAGVHRGIPGAQRVSKELHQAGERETWSHAADQLHFARGRNQAAKMRLRDHRELHVDSGQRQSFRDN